MDSRWLVECMGVLRPIGDIDSTEFSEAVAPVLMRLRSILDEEPDLYPGLKVIFFVDPSGLGYRLAGPPGIVSQAIAAVGPPEWLLLPSH